MTEIEVVFVNIAFLLRPLFNRAALENLIQYLKTHVLYCGLTKIVFLQTLWQRQTALMGGRVGGDTLLGDLQQPG